jgi:hypothetical protein
MPIDADAIERALEAIAKQDGISVNEVKRRLAIEEEVRRARQRGAPDWAIDMIRTCPTADVQDIRAHAQIPSRSAAGTTGQVTKVSSNAGLVGSNTTGWQAPTALTPPPGVAQCDRLMDHQDAVDRHERMMAEAKRQALIKAAEKAASDEKANP